MKTVPAAASRMDHRPAATLAGATAVAAAVITLAVVALPFLKFDYRAPALHVMLETINAVVALLVMYLVYGRLKQDARLQALLLLLALGTVAVANLVLTAVPNALTAGRADELNHWAPLVVRFLATVLLTAASLVPEATRVTRGAAGLITCGLLLLLLVLGAAGMLWRHHLPVAAAPRLASDGAGPLLLVHPAVLVVQGIGIALYGVAAVAFTRQAERRRDQLIRWVAAGCVLASWARVHYLLFPSLYSDYVHTGDLLRLGFYVFMLVGAAREITSFWRAKAQSAVLEDRRRTARDLHDGLIQELSYIYAQSRRLTSNPADPLAVERIGGAAGRAIDEARRALAVLTRPDEAGLPVVLGQSMEELASRYDVKVFTVLDADAEGDGPITEALLRVAGEAVRNAVRHGGATRIDVHLAAAPLSLTVRDDGRGFTSDLPDGGRAGGFGLRSMRERAAGVGAILTIDSTPGEGTTVQVSWV